MTRAAEQRAGGGSGPAADLVNRGIVVLRPDAGRAGQSGRTFIVTGPYRSGTSLVAAMLRHVGVFMGTDINDIVHEDEAFAKVIEGRDHGGLRQLIAGRNAAYGTWGFKLPMLCRWLSPESVAAFNHPHVIATFRDAVAISQRAALSEYRDPAAALRQATDDLAAMARFVAQLACPTLLLSYEKALVFPADFVSALVRFCGLPHSEALCAQLAGLIEPNRGAYIAGARRRYEGRIEGIAAGRLRGWCRLTGVADPVPLDLLADDRLVCSFAADDFRQDLLDAGFGDGRHGFHLELGRLDLRPDTVIRIKVSRHGTELDNSGRRLKDYG